ncbi:MAG: ankyrin repeat domain-containing protein, partial [Candidatus Bathyarchaeota archaeon]|nr:ankyrin repeat domain-containing protein [Candidatus Bathyarchaeota archaeon]
MNEANENYVRTTPYTIDNNDPVIAYYNNELEVYMKEFIDAKSAYDILASRIQYGFALECINRQLKKQRVDWTEESDHYRRNAINHYALSAEKIRQLQKNESILSEKEKFFNFNLIKSIESKLLDSIPANKRNVCMEKIPVKDIYSTFMNLYIDQYDTSFMNLYISRHKAISQKNHKKKNEWFTTLEKYHSSYFEEKREQWLEKEKKREEAFKKKRKERLEKRKKRTKILREKKHQKYLQELKAYLMSTKDTKVIGRGGIPVFYHAILNNDREIIDLFLEYGVDVNQKWKSETVLTTAIKNCKNSELVRVLLEYGADPNLLNGNHVTAKTALSDHCKKD